MAKYEDISNWLREKITDGTFAINEKIPSENELAAKFGYSRQTVRQAIASLETDGILTRAQGSGTYVSRRASKIQQSATMRIGVITTYLDDYIFPGIIHGIEEVLSDHHYTMSLGITHNRQIDEENALHQIITNGVDGLIVEGTKSALPNVNKLLYREIIERGMPIVFLNGYYKSCGESYVIMDDVHAGEISAEALINNGHTKIGGIFKSDDIQGLKRYEGLQNVMKQRGLSLSDNSILWYTTEDLPYLFSGTFDEMILSRFSDITGLLCYNDQIAASLIRLFQRHDISVPENISIVSFDNSPLAGTMSCNLTSVIYPSQEIGHMAAELILKKLADPLCKECIVLTPTLKHRASIRNIKENIEA